MQATNERIIELMNEIGLTVTDTDIYRIKFIYNSAILDHLEEKEEKCQKN